MTALHDALSSVGGNHLVLLAGDTSDLPMLRRLVDSLPGHTPGQVFIEAPDVGAIDLFPAPRGLGVTWLLQDPPDAPDACRCCAEHGSALVRAVRAWLSEMLPADPVEPPCRCVLWVGAMGSSHTLRLFQDLSGPSHGAIHWIHEEALDAGH